MGKTILSGNRQLVYHHVHFMKCFLIFLLKKFIKLLYLKEVDKFLSENI